MHITNYAQGVEHLDALHAVKIATYTVPMKRGQATQVTITVLVPRGQGMPFRTHSIVSVEPNAAGTVLDEATGQSDQPMVLAFTLEVP